MRCTGMLPLWDDAPRRRFPAITFLLIVGNIVVFGYEAWLAWQSPEVLANWLEQHALVPRRLLQRPGEIDEWLTIFSSMFLHGGLAHVLGNVWFLWIFGDNVEERLGWWRYVGLYLLAGLAAAALQVATGPYSPIPMVGASGAISGVLGAYFVLFRKAWIYTLVPWIVPIVPIPAVVFLVVWFGIQAFNGVGALASDAGVQGGVAWWAHAGGFAAGVWLLWSGTLKARGRRS